MTTTTRLTSEELRNSFKYLFPDELVELKRLASLLPIAPTIVNIGAGAGTSGLAFVESRPDATLYTIDKENNPSPLGSLHSERDVFDRAELSHLTGWHWFQIHGDSVHEGRRWDNGPVDAVFVDGDHSYEGCRGDILAWLPHIKHEGLMIVHDYDKGSISENPRGPHPTPWPGVDRAVKELLIPNYELVSVVDSLITFRIPNESKDS